MSEFKILNSKQTNDIDELLRVADSVLGTSTLVIKGNPRAATIVGTAIGGATGAAITAGAGAAGVLGATAGISGTAGLVGVGIASTVALPATILILICSGIGVLIGRNKGKKKEQQKQANYCKELAEKQQTIFEKYQNLKKDHDRTDEKKDQIIKMQQEKIAEYEAIFEALRKKREDLENNLSFA